MPNPNDNVKGTGDVHQPDLDERARSSGSGRPVAEDRDDAQADEATPGKGENQAGFLKDKEAPGPGEGSRSR